MEKDFDAWNDQKKHINERQDVLLYRERDIRWCQLGVNVGFEQDGTGTRRSRPVLVLKAFSRSVCLVVPLTTAKKKNPYYVSLGKVGGRGGGDNFTIATYRHETTRSENRESKRRYL